MGFLGDLFSGSGRSPLLSNDNKEQRVSAGGSLYYVPRTEVPNASPESSRPILPVPDGPTIPDFQAPTKEPQPGILPSNLTLPQPEATNTTMTTMFDNLKKVTPHGNETLMKTVSDNMPYLIQNGINTPNRLNNFLAQLAVESDGFRTAKEYASGKAYEGRKDLGNTSPGDGERYKGRGFIQLTGKYNYTNYGKQLKLDLVNHPELLEDPNNALKISVAYWNDHNLNKYADTNDIRTITKRINGGLNNFDDRMSYLNKFSQLNLLGEAK